MQKGPDETSALAQVPEKELHRAQECAAFEMGKIAAVVEHAPRRSLVAEHTAEAASPPPHDAAAMSKSA